jgi:hypothetical protein
MNYKPDPQAVAKRAMMPLHQVRLTVRRWWACAWFVRGAGKVTFDPCSQAVGGHAADGQLPWAIWQLTCRRAIRSARRSARPGTYVLRAR